MERTGDPNLTTASSVLAATALVVPLAFWPGLSDIGMAPSLLAMQIGILFLVVFWQARGTPLSFGPLGLPAVTYTVLAAASLFYTFDRVAGILELSRLVSGLFLLLAVTCLNGRGGRTAVLAAIAISGTFVSLLGIFEYHGWQPLDIPSSGLPSATFGYRNVAAMWLIQAIPLSVVLLFIGERSWQQWLAAVASSLMLVFLVYTRTRGAWIGLAAAVVVTGLALGRSRPSQGVPIRVPTAPVITAILLLLFLAFLPPGLSRRGPQDIDEQKRDLATALSSFFREGADRGRMDTWTRTLSMWSSDPIAGVGLGGWAVHYPKYDRGTEVTLHVLPTRPHNDWLWVLSELGIMGVVCYAWLIISALACAWHGLRQHGTRILTAGLLTSLVATLSHACFSFPRERPVSLFMMWFVLGILNSIGTGADRRQKTGPGFFGRPAVLGVALISLLLIATTWRLARFELHVRQASQKETQRDWKEVVEHARAALENGRFHHEAVHLQGYGLNQLRRFEESVELYETHLTYRPFDVQMHNGLAIALQGSGALEKAEESFRRAIAITPEMEELRFNIAALFVEKGDTQQALAECDTLLQMEPTEDLVYLVGSMFERLSRPHRAREAYARAAQMRPGSVQAELAKDRVLAREYLDRNEPSKAIAVYDSLLVAGKPTSSLYYLMGEARTVAGDLPLAVEAYSDAIRLKPDFAEAYLALGEALFQIDDSRGDQAVAAFRAFLKFWKGDSRYSDHAMNRIITISGNSPRP